MKDAMGNKRGHSTCLVFSSRYIQRHPHSLIATLCPPDSSFDVRILTGYSAYFSTLLWRNKKRTQNSFLFTRSLNVDSDHLPLISYKSSSSSMCMKMHFFEKEIERIFFYLYGLLFKLLSVSLRSRNPLWGSPIDTSVNAWDLLRAICLSYSISRDWTIIWVFY